MTVKFDLYGEFGDPDQDFYWLSDSEKLRLLADWFDLQDELRGHNEGTDVQDDLRRIAYELEHPEQEDFAWAIWLLVGISFFLLAVFFLA